MGDNENYEQFAQTLDVLLEHYGVDDCTEGWHLIREQRITASKVAVVCGCSEYATPWALAAYRMCLSQERGPGNAVTEHGVNHEGTCLIGFERVTGNRLVAAPYRNDWLMRWMGATPDALIPRDALCPLGRPALVEAKCPFYDMYRMPPLAYIFQTQLQMHVYQVAVCYLVAWFEGRLTVWRIHFSRRLYAYFLTFALRYRACVQAGVVPDSAAMQMIPHEARSFAESGFDETKREAIAFRAGIQPHQLPPKPRIELVCRDVRVGGTQAKTMADAREMYARQDAAACNIGT